MPKSDTTPFRGRTTKVSAPMRVLHRFTKQDGHWAEILVDDGRGYES